MAGGRIGLSGSVNLSRSGAGAPNFFGLLPSVKNQMKTNKHKDMQENSHGV